MRWNSRTSNLLLPSYFSLPNNKGTFLGTPETTLLAMRSTFSFKTFSISSAPKCFPVFLPMKIPFSTYAAVRSMTNVWYTLWKRFLRKLEGDWGSWWMSLVKYPQWGDQKVSFQIDSWGLICLKQALMAFLFLVRQDIPGLSCVFPASNLQFEANLKFAFKELLFLLH